MRTFHIGGTASRRAEQTTLEARNEGVVRLHGVNTVQEPRRQPGRDDAARRSRYRRAGHRRRPAACASANASAIRWSTAPSCARPRATRSRRGELIAEWDPYTTPIITEVGGTVKYGDIIEGKTMEERVDERTGARSNVIVENQASSTCARVSRSRTRSGKTAEAADIANNVRALLPAGRRVYQRARRHRQVVPGRRHREDSARDHQDQGHHRRSAARRGTVRGAQAQGVRRHLGNRRPGLLRQGYQGQAQGRRHARKSASRAST